MPLVFTHIDCNVLETVAIQLQKKFTISLPLSTLAVSCKILITVMNLKSKWMSLAGFLAKRAEIAQKHQNKWVRRWCIPMLSHFESVTCQFCRRIGHASDSGSKFFTCLVLDCSLDTTDFNFLIAAMRFSSSKAFSATVARANQTRSVYSNPSRLKLIMLGNPFMPLNVCFYL